MKGLSHYLVIFVGIATISALVIEADVYEFDTSGQYTSEYCSNHQLGIVTAVSNIECGVKCGRNALCRGFVYEPETTTCIEIHVRINNFPDGRCQAVSGNNYYARKVPACVEQYLISGPEPVADSQLTESSFYCDELLQVNTNYCDPPEMRWHSAWYARISSSGKKTGAWTAYHEDEDQYVQVDFLQPKIVAAVILTGRSIDIPDVQYATSFKVLYSDDCSWFKEVVYDTGNAVVFEGNNNGNDVVRRPLPERIEARCFRINPLAFVGLHHSLRFDLEGCL